MRTPAGAELCAALRRLRREHGLTQRGLLGPLNLASHSAIADYESGKRIPAPDILAAYERFFGPSAARLRGLRQRALAERAAAEAERTAGGADGGTDAHRPGGLFGAQPVLSSDLPPMQLPADLADFTGRRAELLAAGVPRPVTVVAGPPGIGKTVFAVHLAHLHRDRYPDGHLFADLHGCQQPRLELGDVLGRFLRALGVPAYRVPADQDEKIALYRSVTAMRRLLVVLDNACDEAQVRGLLPTGAGCGVLITSRPLLPGIEGAVSIQLGVPPVEDAMTLLASIAGTERVMAEPQTARKVVRLCGLLPLAVRVAGARLASRPGWRLADLSATLDDERARLGELIAGDLDVRAAFDLSYRMLDDGARRAYRLLGVTPTATFTPGAVAALTGLGAGHCARLIESLVDLSLVEAIVPGRYRLHDLLRLYAADRARAEDDPAVHADAVAALLTWYLEMADAADRLIVPGRRRVTVPRQPHWKPPFCNRVEALAWCAEERAELAQATRAAADAGRHDLAWQLPNALWGFFNLRRNWMDWLPMLDTGLRSARAISDWTGQAGMLASLGLAYLDLRRADDAICCLEPFLAIATAAGDNWSQAMALTGLGMASRDLNRLDEAVYCLTRAVQRDDVADHWRAGFTKLGLGLAYRDLHRPDESLTYLEQALAIFEAAHDRLGEVWTLQNLGLACRELHRPDDSVAFLLRALAIRQELGDVKGEAEVWLTLGNLYLELGLTDECEKARAQGEALAAIPGEAGFPPAADAPP